MQKRVPCLEFMSNIGIGCEGARPYKGGRLYTLLKFLCLDRMSKTGPEIREWDSPAVTHAPLTAATTFGRVPWCSLKILLSQTDAPSGVAGLPLTASALD